MEKRFARALKHVHTMVGFVGLLSDQPALSDPRILETGLPFVPGNQSHMVLIGMTLPLPLQGLADNDIFLFI